MEQTAVITLEEQTAVITTEQTVVITIEQTVVMTMCPHGWRSPSPMARYTVIGGYTVI
jgi:hypothetical protein